jgi:hypothetical protein
MESVQDHLLKSTYIFKIAGDRSAPRVNFWVDTRWHYVRH